MSTITNRQTGFFKMPAGKTPMTETAIRYSPVNTRHTAQALVVPKIKIPGNAHSLKQPTSLGWREMPM